MIAQSGKPGLQKQNECLGPRQPHAMASMSQWPPKHLKYLFLFSDQSPTNFSSQSLEYVGKLLNSNG